MRRGRRHVESPGDSTVAGWFDAAVRGDPEAFGQLWLLLSPRVHGYLRGRGVASAEDTTSEVFLAAFAGLPGFRGNAADFRAWLFTIAHHKSVDSLRRERTHESYDDAADQRSTPSAESLALTRHLDARVVSALAGLGDDQREILLLRTLGDLSIDEVARITGRTTGSVKQAYRRAVISTHRALEADPGDADPPAHAEVGVSAAPGRVTRQGRATITEM